jgi:hypothetical protein
MSLKNPVIPPVIDPGTVRLVAQRLDHYATPGPDLPKVIQQKTNKPLFVKVKSRSVTRTALVADRFDIQAMSSF